MLNSIKQFYNDNKKKIVWTVKIILSVLLLYILVNYLAFNNITSIIKKANYFYVSAAFIMVFFNIYIQYLRWKLICKDAIRDIKSDKILKSIFIGIASGLITPFRVGEFFGRAYLFEGDNFHKAISLSVFDRLLSMCSTFIVGSGFFLYFIKIYFNVNTSIIITIVVSSLGLIFSLLTVIYFGIIKAPKMKFLQKIVDYFEVLKELNKKTLIYVFILAVIFFLTYIFQFALLMSGFLGAVDFLTYFYIGILVFYTNTIIPPITFGELGIRESAAIFFTSFAGYNSVAGFNSSVLLFVFNVLIPSFIGLIIYLRYKR